MKHSIWPFRFWETYLSWGNIAAALHSSPEVETEESEGRAVTSSAFHFSPRFTLLYKCAHFKKKKKLWERKSFLFPLSLSFTSFSCYFFSRHRLLGDGGADQSFLQSTSGFFFSETLFVCLWSRCTAEQVERPGAHGDVAELRLSPEACDSIQVIFYCIFTVRSLLLMSRKRGGKLLHKCAFMIPKHKLSLKNRHKCHINKDIRTYVCRTFKACKPWINIKADQSS